MRINTSDFAPDFKHIQKAAFNISSERLPLYEHIISDKIMEEITGTSFRLLRDGDFKDKCEYFKHYCGFFKTMGYDSVSFECCIGAAMPHSGCLGNHAESVIHTYEDFEKYPWQEIPDKFFEEFGSFFDALKETMPNGMKAIGGVGNGVFECVQDIIGYQNLCFISADDPELYEALFRKAGEISLIIWERFLRLYGDLYCVLRFGDDLGFKSNTLLSTTDIKRLIIPEYAKIIRCVHAQNKPFLLHSCGKIFDVMPELIRVAKINAKHSNEDQIAAFPVWVEKYGDEIGNFGGIDTNALCVLSPKEIREYVTDVLKKSVGHGGIAFGSGNSIADYVPPENYLEMVNTVREFRAE